MLKKKCELKPDSTHLIEEKVKVKVKKRNHTFAQRQYKEKLMN